MLKNFCIDQSQININNATDFFNVAMDYLVTEHIGDRFEIEDLRKSLDETDDPFFKKMGWFPIRIIWKKNLFHGFFNSEIASKFKETQQKQKGHGYSCPFYHLRIFAGQEEVFGSFEHGGIIILNFDDLQVEKFKEYLVKVGLPTSMIVASEEK